METQLRHNLADGATHLRGRFKVSSADDVVSRAYLNVNTTRSTVNLDGYVRKFVSLLGTKHRLADDRLRAGAGVRCVYGSNITVLFNLLIIAVAMMAFRQVLIDEHLRRSKYMPVPLSKKNSTGSMKVNEAHT